MFDYEKYDPEKFTLTDDDDSGGEGGGNGGHNGGGGNDRKPFRRGSHAVQADLAKGEKTFGEIDWSRRETEPPPEETENRNYTEEDELAAANDSVAEPHEFLVCQQFDGVDPKRDPRIASIDDLVNYAENHPEAQLTLDPVLRLALENAKRHSYTPSMKPAGM